METTKENLTELSHFLVCRPWSSDRRTNALSDQFEHSEHDGIKEINDVDQGIAFDDIDIEKTFCLAVSIDHAEDSIEIID